MGKYFKFVELVYPDGTRVKHTFKRNIDGLWSCLTHPDEFAVIEDTAVPVEIPDEG